MSTTRGLALDFECRVEGPHAVGPWGVVKAMSNEDVQKALALRCDLESVLAAHYRNLKAGPIGATMLRLWVL